MSLRRSARATTRFGIAAIACFLLAIGLGVGGSCGGLGSPFLLLAFPLGFATVICGAVWLIRTFVAPKPKNTGPRGYEDS